MMQLNSWVRLRNGTDGDRGRVVMFGARDENGNYRVVWVDWIKAGRKQHRPEDLEVCEER